MGCLSPLNRGEFADDPDRKKMRAYLPVPWDPASWHDTGLPAWIELIMQEGVVIRPEVKPPFADHPFYRWDSSEALHRAIVQVDRHGVEGGGAATRHADLLRGTASAAPHQDDDAHIRDVILRVMPI